MGQFCRLSSWLAADGLMLISIDTVDQQRKHTHIHATKFKSQQIFHHAMHLLVLGLDAPLPYSSTIAHRIAGNLGKVIHLATWRIR